MQQPKALTIVSGFVFAQEIVPGLGLCLAIALVAQLLAHWVPLVGGAVFAILMGMVLTNLVRLPNITKTGISFASKRVLQFSIILLGGNLSVYEVFQAGEASLVVMLATLALGLVTAILLGKLLRVGPVLTTLVGVGTGICGGSAIAAVAPIIRAEDDDIAFAISTVFLFNVVAVVAFPALGHMLQLTQHGFGIWAGTAINDTSSVVAAAYSYGQQAGDLATVTKLARTTMIVPIALVLALWVSRCGGEVTCSFRQVFPWFILWFLAMSVGNSLGLLGNELPAWLGQAGKFCIALALAGVGLGANLQRMLNTGPRPVLLGLLTWVGVALSSLAMQRLLGQV